MQTLVHCKSCFSLVDCAHELNRRLLICLETVRFFNITLKTDLRVSHFLILPYAVILLNVLSALL